MPELSFKEITDKLNSEFTDGERKLIFWYDAAGEFAEDVDTLELKNAKIYHLRRDNQFRTKILLEREDTTTNYLIYAPFPKPDARDNHLEDTLRYSKEFFADKASFLAADLGMDERCKAVLQKYIKFFSDKKRTQAFYDLEIASYSRTSIELGIMSVLCRCRQPVFEEIVRCVLLNSSLEDNALLAEFSKYGLLEPFWTQCALEFGYAAEEPTLTKLAMTLFATSAEKSLHGELPPSWRPFVSPKSGTAAAFLDNLMHSVLYRSGYDDLAEKMYSSLDGDVQLKKLPTEALVDCDLFAGADEILLQWITDRLLNEDVDAKLAGKSIPEICAMRRRMHFGEQYHDAYSLLENAWYIVKPGIYEHSGDAKLLVKKYTAEYYKIDRRYRYFYCCYDKLEEQEPYELLRVLVERIYTNDYLNPLLADFSQALASASSSTGISRQVDFYGLRVKSAADRVAVIISDALRYEVGVSLFEKLREDEKCRAEISVMQSALPSVTRVGMAALLPHRKLEVIDADNVLVDGRPTVDLKQREAVLQSVKPRSRAVQFDNIKTMSVEELRGIFARQDVVYIYHNQIDARGDKQATENEVFVACEEAVDEIARLIRRLTTSANTSHFIVTADHGFLYKRDKLTGSDKIGSIPGADNRYVITETPIEESGVWSLPLGRIFGIEDSRVVNFPVGSDLFCAPGPGKNYTHGGCSPQEILIPVIDVKTMKAKRETGSAAIDLVSILNKITNLITTLDFIQTEPISDVVKEMKYRIFFLSDAGEKISNEQLFKADKRDADASKRIFRLRFTFKNKKYDKSRQYYLVAVDENDREVLRRAVTMDLAFADDFGF